MNDINQEMVDKALGIKPGEDRKAIMDANPPKVYDVSTFYISIGWGWKGCGFGELWIRLNPKTGKYEYDTECMGPESVRKFLYALADKVVDDLKTQGAFP